jgi:hypothetical protein
VHVPDQALLDAEHRIGVQVRAVGDEHVRGHRPVPGRGDDEVHVRRPVGMPAGGSQQLPDRTVVGDRVEARHDRAEPVPPLVVGGEQPAQVARRLDAGLLDVVKAVLVGLPDVHRRTVQRLAVRTGHPARHQARAARAVE